MSIQMEWSPHFRCEVAILNEAQELMVQGIEALVQGQSELFDSKKYDRVVLDLKPYFGEKECLAIQKAIDTKKITSYAKKFFKEKNTPIKSQFLKKEPILCFRVSVLAHGFSKLIDQMEECVTKRLEDLVRDEIFERRAATYFNEEDQWISCNKVALFVPLGIVSIAFVINGIVLIACLFGDNYCDENSRFNQRVEKDETCFDQNNVPYSCKKVYCRDPETGSERNPQVRAHPCFDSSVISIQVLTGICLFTCLIPLIGKCFEHLRREEAFNRAVTYFPRRVHRIRADELKQKVETHRVFLDEIRKNKTKQQLLLHPLLREL